MKKLSNDDGLIRLSEILYRSWYILSQINSDKVSDFMRRYSVDVGEGLQFLKMFGTYFPSIQEHSSASYSKVLSDIVDLDVFKHHLIGGKLSIFHQLEQILARWRVHHWIMDNLEMIRWLSQRSAFYPTLLAKLAGKTAMVDEREVSLPTVKIEWLIELAAQHLGSTTMADDIAKALCDRQYHSHILHFSAKIHEINSILLRIERYADQSLIQTLNFVFDNPSFFEGILGKENVFRVTFARYLMANTKARNFCGQIASHKKAMIELFKPINRLNILSNNEKLEYCGPLLNLLVSGVLDSGLPMLVELSKISSDQIERNQVLRVFTWLEQYREIIALTFGPENAWQAWIAKHPEHQPAITAFSEGLSMALLGCELRLFSDLPQDKRPLKGKIYFQDLGDRLGYRLLSSTDKVRQGYLDIDCQNNLNVDFLEANRSAILTKLEKRTQYFSESASDVRPAKTVGNSDVFPCALACFIDCFSGLPAQERSTDQGCMQYDVLLSQFLFDQRNVGVVTHIDQHIAAVSPVIEAFKQDQALMVQPKMEQSLPASTKRADASVNEDFSSPLRSIQSPNQQTPTKPPRKKRQMVIEEPENRVGMSLN